MKEVFEAMLGVVFLITVMFTSTTIISTSIDARNADATIQSYVTEMEHSNFSESVLKAVFDQAAADGYTDASMMLYIRDDVGTTYKQLVRNGAELDAYKAANPDKIHRIYMVRLNVTYTYSMEFITASWTHEMSAYAR